MTSKDSKFYIDIANELGLGYKKNRAKLLGTALGKPANYYLLRAELVEKLTEKQVTDAYKMYWDLLKLGWLPGTTTAHKYKDGNDKDALLVPDVPEHLINKMASRIAATMEEIAEECVNMIMPEDFLKLAHEKQKDILSAKGLI
jgi:hypothetical protein